MLIEYPQHISTQAKTFDSVDLGMKAAPTIVTGGPHETYTQFSQTGSQTAIKAAYPIDNKRNTIKIRVRNATTGNFNNRKNVEQLN